MVILLTREARISRVKNDGHLKDVPKGVWFETMVFEAERYGLLKADEEGYIHPEIAISRAEFLKMMAYAFGLPENMPHRYRDVAGTDWYAKFAGIAAQYELFPGPQTRLLPGNFLTHEEVSGAIQALLEKRGKNFPSLEALAETRHRAAHQPNLSNRQEQVIVLRPPKAAKPKRVPVVMPTQEEPVPVILNAEKIAELRSLMLKRVNEKRREAGVAPLTLDPKLTNSAQAYAEAIVRDNFFSHVSPSGQTLKQRIEASGYYMPFFNGTCIGGTSCVREYILGENLAQGQKTVDEVIADWLDSSEHRKAMLNPAFTDLGIGIAAGIWVQHFGGIR